MAANCISGYPIMFLKFGQFLHNKHVAPTGLSFVEENVSIDMSPLRGCASLHLGLFFCELRLWL